MTGVVIDASVLIKLFVDEKGSSESERAVKAADELLAPDLLLPETASVLWKYVRRGELSPVDANSLMADILQMRIRISPSEDLIEPALRIAIETGRTVYDSLYIALALQSATILLTADERLVHAIATTKYANHVTLVGAL